MLAELMGWIAREVAGLDPVGRGADVAAAWDDLGLDGGSGILLSDCWVIGMKSEKLYKGSSFQSTCSWTEVHLFSSWPSISSSPLITNHHCVNLFLVDLRWLILNFLLTVKLESANLVSEAMVFNTARVVALGWVPQIFLAPGIGARFLLVVD